MLLCKGQCDFSTCKDLVCLLSNLVGHTLIAYGPLGSFSSFVIFLYILLGCQLQTSRINLAILSQDFLCLGLDFKQEPACHAVKCKVRVAIGVKSWAEKCDCGKKYDTDVMTTVIGLDMGFIGLVSGSSQNNLWILKLYSCVTWLPANWKPKWLLVF